MQANLNVLPLEKLMASMPGAIWLCAVPQNTSAVEYLLMHQITSQVQFGCALCRKIHLQLNICLCIKSHPKSCHRVSLIFIFREPSDGWDQLYALQIPQNCAMQF